MAMTWVYEKHRYQKIAESIEPAARLFSKDHWVWPFAWYVALILVTLITLGIGAYFFLKKMGKKVFLENYATTFGPIQAYPKSYERLSVRLLVHECQHTKQAVFFGYFVPIIGWIPGKTGRRIRAYAGLLWMALFYLVILFPVWLCYGRYWVERNADEASYRWMLENGYDAKQVRERAAEFAEKVGGGQYFFAWPIWLVRRGFAAAAERAVSQHVTVP